MSEPSPRRKGTRGDWELSRSQNDPANYLMDAAVRGAERSAMVWVDPQDMHGLVSDVAIKRRI